MKHRKAKILAALAAQSPLLLFAGRTATTAAVQTARYKEHKCTACSTVVAFGTAAEGVVPFCPHCSNVMTPSEVEVQVLPQEDQLTSVGCPACSTNNVVEDRMADALGGKLACTACGTQISYLMASSDEDEGDDEDDAEETEGVEPKETAAEIDSELDSASDTGNDGPEGDEEDRDANRESTTETADAASDAANAVADGARAAADAARQATEEVDADGSLDLGLGSDVEAAADDEDEIEVDLTDAVDEDGEVEVKLDEDGTEARLLAFVDGVHVATLVKADAGDNADILVHASFHQALSREAAKKGHRALAAFGFKPVSVKVQIAKLVEKRVQAALAADQAKVEAKLGDLSADYNQCLQIASAALTTNFYRNRPNPLVNQLVANLETAGVRQARKIVTNAMLAAGPQYATALLELSEELMDKSVETRNELSDTLSQMNPAATAGEVDFEDEEDQGDDEDNGDSEFASLKDRLTAGVHVAPRSRNAETAHADLSGLGARLRDLKNL